MESASVAVSSALETPDPGSEHSANTNDLAKLLARLDDDPEQAALKYEHLRRALIRYFDWRGGSSADECADEALDRLTRRMSGTTVHDVYKYAHGIARLVLLERRRAPVLASIDDVPEATLVAPVQRDEPQRSARLFRAMPGWTAGRQPRAAAALLRRAADGEDPQSAPARVRARHHRKRPAESRAASPRPARTVRAGMCRSVAELYAVSAPARPDPVFIARFSRTMHAEWASCAACSDAGWYARSHFPLRSAPRRQSLQGPPRVRSPSRATASSCGTEHRERSTSSRWTSMRTCSRRSVCRSRRRWSA